MDRDPQFLKWLYDETRIVRRPTFGIHSGYHDLPYILVGDSPRPGYRTTEIRGKILVSPKVIVTPGDDGPSYSDVFDPATMDATIVGRLFAFKFQRKPVEIQQEDFQRRELEYSVADALNRIADELERREVINTGVIQTPRVDFYPVALDRFITSILDQEFS